MFFPGYEATMLALEANSVIGLRLIKIAHGGVDAVHEVHLMVQEKVEAGAEAMATLVGGGGVEAVLAGYRRRVAFNAQRLSPGSSITVFSQHRRSHSSRERRPCVERLQLMNKKLEANDNIARDQSGDKSDRGNVQGEALQMNDNSAEGKRPAEVTSGARVGEEVQLAR